MKTVTLEFEEDGRSVEVRVSGVPVADLYAINEQAAGIPRDLKAYCALAERFAPFLVAWTFDEPLDADGLIAIGYSEMMAILRGWTEGVILAPPPLLRRSSATDTSQSEGHP